MQIISLKTPYSGAIISGSPMLFSRCCIAGRVFVYITLSVSNCDPQPIISFWNPSTNGSTLTMYGMFTFSCPRVLYETVARKTMLAKFSPGFVAGATMKEVI